MRLGWCNQSGVVRARLTDNGLGATGLSWICPRFVPANKNGLVVFKWRRELRAGLLGHSDSCTLLPVTLPSAPDTGGDTHQAMQPSDAVAQQINSGIEIELNGARVRVHGTVDPIQLRLVLRCLMPA